MAQITLLTGPERRRRWSDDERQRILVAAFAPGAVVADVARQFEVSASLIYKWRQQALPGAPTATLRWRPEEKLRIVAETEVPGGAQGPGGTAGQRSGNLDATGAGQAVAARRGRQGDGLHAEAMGDVHPVPDRWADLPDQQCRGARPARRGPGPEIMVARRQ